jgi:hypothetical protein
MTNPSRTHFLITDTSHREKRENMRRISVIDNDHRRPAKSHLVTIGNWIFFTISHFNKEWYALLNCRLDLLACHTGKIDKNLKGCQMK